MLPVKPQNCAIRPQVSMASPWAHFSRSRALRVLSAAIASSSPAQLDGRGISRGARGQLPAGGVDVVAARRADVDRQAVGAQGVLEGADAPLDRALEVQTLDGIPG